MKRHKRQPRVQKIKTRVDWKDLNIVTGAMYAFFKDKQKKTPCLTGEIIGTVENGEKKCITVKIKSSREDKNLVGKEVSFSYVPSKQMWHLLKKNQGTGHIFNLKMAA